MQQDLTVIEEVDLEEFVAQAKHDRMTSFQPLLDVDKSIISLELDLLLRHLLNLFIQMHYESLEKKVLLLKVTIFGHRVSFVTQYIFLF